MNENLINSINESIVFFTNHLDSLKKKNDINEILKADFNDKISLNKFDFFKKINNVSSLITISHLDLLVAIKSLSNSLNNWEKIYSIKNSYLTIFETFKTYEEYRRFLYEISVNVWSNLKEELSEINLEIRNFKEKWRYETEMSKIRNSIAGHISDDFDLYYNTIINFDGEEAAKIVLAFLEIIQKLQNFLTKIMLNEISIKEEEEILKLMTNIEIRPRKRRR